MTHDELLQWKIALSTRIDVNNTLTATVSAKLLELVELQRSMEETCRELATAAADLTERYKQLLQAEADAASDPADYWKGG